VITVRSMAFEPDGPIPQKYTADGENISPPLEWLDLPPGTREVAVIVDDPDAPTPKPWVHWVIYKIPLLCSGLMEGVPRNAKLAQGVLQGQNSCPNSIGYRGPSPPPGHGVHHYYFKVYALDTELVVAPGLDVESLMKAMAAHVLGEGETIGTYQR